MEFKEHVTFSRNRKIFAYHCPYGRVGDKLWVRETWALWDASTDEWEGEIHRGPIPKPGSEASLKFWRRHVMYCASEDYTADTPWRSPMFMPRWASRLTLEVTGVKVERVQDINEWDVLEEGINIPADGKHSNRKQFAELWDSINTKRPGCTWADNPFVWCISFRRMTSE